MVVDCKRDCTAEREAAREDQAAEVRRTAGDQVAKVVEDVEAALGDA